MAILAIMMIPGVLTLIPQYVLVHNMGLTGSLWGIIPAAAGVALQYFPPEKLFRGAATGGVRIGGNGRSFGNKKVFHVRHPSFQAHPFHRGADDADGLLERSHLAPPDSA